MTEGSADVAFSGIDSLCRIDWTVRDQGKTPVQCTQLHHEQVWLVLEKLCMRLKEREGQVPPSTMLDREIAYTVWAMAGARPLSRPYVVEP